VPRLTSPQGLGNRHLAETYAGTPVLSPLRSKNRVDDQAHHYEWNGKILEMPQHGFARRSKWSSREQDAASVRLELTDTEATRVNYPFAFRLCLTYRLSQGRLHWEQVIENCSAEPLPFSTGFHPYFAVPLTPKSRRDACFVE